MLNQEISHDGNLVTGNCSSLRLAVTHHFSFVPKSDDHSFIRICHYRSTAWTWALRCVCAIIVCDKHVLFIANSNSCGTSRLSITISGFNTNVDFIHFDCLIFCFSHSFNYECVVFELREPLWVHPAFTIFSKDSSCIANVWDCNCIRWEVVSVKNLVNVYLPPTTHIF